MIPLDRAVVARLESHGEKFEILVDPDLSVKYRQGDPIEIEDMVAAISVFENSSRGTRASDESLNKVFHTTDFPPIAEKIIRKGVIQLRMRPRQMDRRLAPYRRPGQTGRYGGTKPGRLLKHHIPLRTDRWDVTVPGFTEIDLVAHCGDSGDGEFAHSLNLTDIHTTWVETRAVLGRGQHAVQQALEEVRQVLPFRLQGIDSDNGSEFINAHLVRYCQRQRIQFTRGRPYKKDDNAHIAQQNWTHAEAPGLPPVRLSRGGGRPERALPAGAPPLPEPVPALGQARPQGAHRRPDPPRV